MVEAELSPGGQWRVPISEIQRLKTDGVPPCPTAIQEPAQQPPVEQPSENPDQSDDPEELYGEPSDELKEAAEEAIITEKQVTVAENKLRQRRIQKEATELDDFFQEREQRKDQQQRAEAVKLAQLEEARQHHAWIQQWVEQALSALWDVPGPIRIQLADVITERLHSTPRTEPDALTRRIIEALTDTTLAPWKHLQAVDRAIEWACGQLPYGLRYSAQSSHWKAVAAQAIRKAVEVLGQGATSGQMQTAALLAIRPIVLQFEHVERCRKIATDLPAGLTSQEQEDAREQIAEALAPLPADTSQRKLEQTAAAVLGPFNEKLKKRKDQEFRADVLNWQPWFPYTMSTEDRETALAEAKEAVAKVPFGSVRAVMESARDEAISRITREHQEEQAEEQRIVDLAEIGVSAIFAYLQALNKKYEFEKSIWTIERELKDPVREGLRDELEGDESHDEVRKLAHRIIREELDLE